MQRIDEGVLGIVPGPEATKVTGKTFSHFTDFLFGA